jgi:hypothetical protein
LHQHRAGRGVDLVVDQRELAFFEQLAGLRIGIDFERLLGLVLFDLG